MVSNKQPSIEEDLLKEVKDYKSSLKELNAVLTLITHKKPSRNFRGWSLPKSSMETVMKIAEKFGYSQEDLEVLKHCFLFNEW